MVWYRWDPFAELQREANRLFDRTGLDWTWLRQETFPALNLWEDGDNIYAEAELPGMTAEDLEVAVSGNELTLKGQRKDGQPEGATYHRRERANVEFSRTLTLPCDIDGEKVQARMQNGLLSLTLPKAPEVKARKVPVKAA